MMPGETVNRGELNDDLSGVLGLVRPLDDLYLLFWTECIVSVGFLWYNCHHKLNQPTE